MHLQRLSAGLLLTLATISCGIRESDIPPSQPVRRDTLTTDIVLGPHECTAPQETDTGEENIRASLSPDGRAETLPARGTRLSLTGGDRIIISYYADGREDTALLTTHDYRTETSLTAIIEGDSGRETTQGTAQIRPAEVMDDICTIHPIGCVTTHHVMHRLTVSSHGKTKTFHLRQNNNVILHGGEETSVRCHLISSRDTLPSWKDYPEGSNPPWHRSDGFWWQPDQSRELHPTQEHSRLVLLEPVRLITYEPARYRSGAADSTRTEQTRIQCSSLTVTAEADIPTDNGPQHVTHTFIWSENAYRNRRLFGMLIPIHDEANGNFTWKVCATACMKTGDRLATDTVTVDEDIRTYEELCERYGIGGIMAGTKYADAELMHATLADTVR